MDSIDTFKMQSLINSIEERSKRASVMTKSQSLSSGQQDLMFILNIEIILSLV